MKLCPSCRTALKIGKSYTRVEGDQSSETPTRVYLCQELYCRNPACPQAKGGQAVETVEHRVV
ncbi:hypothetical protein H8699_09785 [Christensenellaceae bacterium NSJ-44]|uniref:Uncharacterized protein n=1 Tax=Luoshenia tenuis TaxID=2763654 RepID=A0A926D0W9_9FIRM|nr:hypothetical protein [Luoshenia tenuis]MBC8529718.1 hypothetical protein [Luoshenia tenuis]